MKREDLNLEASILDLRYKMKDILKALDRNESVKILYHGKLRGLISPCQRVVKIKVKQHPFFGMQTTDETSVSDVMAKLRGGRYGDL